MILITDEDAQKAANYLRDNAEDAAEARAVRKYLEEFRKTMKSKAMQQAAAQAGGVMPLQAQERDAYADPEYILFLDRLKEAIYQDERFSFLREAAQAKISAWQTLNKNIRGVT